MTRKKRFLERLRIFFSGRLTSTMLFLIVMLSALVILHFYWFIIILRILVTMLRGKKNYNLYDTAGKKKAEDGVTTSEAATKETKVQ